MKISELTSRWSFMNTVRDGSEYGRYSSPGTLSLRPVIPLRRPPRVSGRETLPPKESEETLSDVADSRYIFCAVRSIRSL